jgi:hypothetical protein
MPIYARRLFSGITTTAMCIIQPHLITHGGEIGKLREPACLQAAQLFVSIDSNNVSTQR